MRLGAVVFIAGAATVDALRFNTWLDRAIVSYIAHGGRLEDDQLRTPTVVGTKLRWRSSQSTCCTSATNT
jgi:hypothetical protein